MNNGGEPPVKRRRVSEEPGSTTRTRDPSGSERTKAASIPDALHLEDIQHHPSNGVSSIKQEAHDNASASSNQYKTPVNLLASAPEPADSHPKALQDSALIDRNALPKLETENDVASTHISAPAPGNADAERADSYMRSVGLESIVEAVDVLSEAKVRRLLAHYATRVPTIAMAVLAEHHTVLEEERSRIVDFDHLSKSVWHFINPVRHRSRYDEDDSSYEAAQSVVETIDEILDTVKPYSSFATKRSAVETLRKIGKTVCLSRGDIASDIRFDFRHERLLERVMVKILEHMSMEERMIVRDYHDGDFRKKMEELCELSVQEDVFGHLDEVRDLLQMTPEPDTGSSEDEAKDCSNESSSEGSDGRGTD